MLKFSSPFCGWGFLYNSKAHQDGAWSPLYSQSFLLLFMPLLLQHIRIAIPPSVFYDSCGLISPISTHNVSILSCVSVTFAFICVYIICLAFEAEVSLAILNVLLCLLNNFSIDGAWVLFIKYFLIKKTIHTNCIIIILCYYIYM